MAFNVTGYATVSDIQQGEPGEASPQHANQRFWRSSDSSQVGVTVSARINWSTGAYDNITSGWSTTAPTAGATGTTVAYFADINFNDSTGLATHTTATGTGQRFINFSGVVTFTNSGNITDGTSSQAFGNLAANNTVAVANEVTGTGNLATANAVSAANQVNSLNAGNVSGLGNLATDNTTLGNLAGSNTTLGNLATSNTTLGNLAGANAVNAANQVNAFNTAINANTTTIDGGRINTGQVTGGNAAWSANGVSSGSGFSLTTGSVGNTDAGAFFVGNKTTGYMEVTPNGSAFNLPVTFGTTNLPNNVTVQGNTNVVLNNNTSYSVNVTNQVNGTGNLATANTVNAANQVNALNAGNVSPG